LKLFVIVFMLGNGMQNQLEKSISNQSRFSGFSGFSGRYKNGECCSSF